MSTKVMLSVDTPNPSARAAAPSSRTSEENFLRKKALSAIGKLPPFSPVLNRLLATLAAEDTSFASLGELIEKDTVVAGNVLKVVNSAMYARRKEITSVRHALSILGIEKIRNLVLGMSISRMLTQAKPPSPLSMKQFNQHSAATAILADLLVQRVPCHYPEGAFVAGLLHDVGKLLISLGLPSEFKRVVEQFRQSDASWVECEQKLLGFTHAELSRDVLFHWQVPEPIQMASLEHHNDWTHQPVPTADSPAPLARILDAANQFVAASGGNVFDLEKMGRKAETFSADHPPRIVSLGLPDNVLDETLAAYETEYDAMKVFFT